MTLEDRDFTRLMRYMYDNFGINLEKKRTLIEGRLSNTLQIQGYTSFHDYIDDVMADRNGSMVNELITRLTTNYTYFMREEVHYEFMSKVALPEWTRKIPDRDLRIWSAGCSSGEEAYTAAMVISEYLGAHKSQWDSTLLATDISPKVLTKAKLGIYSAGQLEGIPKSWKQKYFRDIGDDQYQVSQELQKEVVFGQFNLMNSFSQFKKKFHIIFCRNVMIYFDNPTKAALTKKFYDVLDRGGYLFIGLSETLSGVNDRFELVSPAIYRKGS